MRVDSGGRVEDSEGFLEDMGRVDAEFWGVQSELLTKRISQTHPPSDSARRQSRLCRMPPTSVRPRACRGQRACCRTPCSCCPCPRRRRRERRGVRRTAGRRRTGGGRCLRTAVRICRTWCMHGGGGGICEGDRDMRGGATRGECGISGLLSVRLHLSLSPRLTPPDSPPPDSPPPDSPPPASMPARILSRAIARPPVPRVLKPVSPPPNTSTLIGR